MLIFSRIRFKWLIVLAVLGLSAFQALTDAMFHTIILNALFVFFALAIELRLNLFKKISIILASAMVLFFLQTFKLEYREMVWSGKAKDPVGLFVTMMTNSVNSDVEEKDKTAVNSRLNQGWIISVIYDRYKTEEYLGGETVKEAFNSAILPRFLNPSKKGGGGKYTFETLTGLQLLSGTAMGTSLLGEFYGNFGFWGSVFSFIIWGVLLNFVVRKMYDFQKEYVVMILFLPLIFYQIVKAESDMLTVLNHLVKSLIVLASVFFIIKRVEVK